MPVLNQDEQTGVRDKCTWFGARIYKSLSDPWASANFAEVFPKRFLERSYLLAGPVLHPDWQ